MRIASMILAFVSCVGLTTVRAEARPSGDRVAEAKKTKKTKKKTVEKTVEKPKAKSSAKKKSSTKAKPAEKIEKAEEAPVVEEAKPEPKPASKSTATVRPGGSPVAQAGDDEVPRNEPAKQKR